MAPYRFASDDFAPAPAEEDEAFSPFVNQDAGAITESPESEEWRESPFSDTEMEDPDRSFGEAYEDMEETEDQELDQAEADREFPEREQLYEADLGGEMEMETERWQEEVAYAQPESWSELELPASVFPTEAEEEYEQAYEYEEAYEDEENYEDEEAYEEEGTAALEAGFSPLARRAPKLHPGHGDRKPPWLDGVYGLVVHTTGGSLPGKARAAGIAPDIRAVRHYLGTGGTHYVNGAAGIDGGQLHQVMNERKIAYGVGYRKDEPKKNQWISVKAGRFEADLPPTLLRLWRARWPGVKTSLDLLPVRAGANGTYIHVECPPVVYHQKGIKGKVMDPEYQPMRPGLRFTRAQHESVARLAWDIAGRYGWPKGQAWWRTPRLVGHEDLTPIARHDGKEGWDPGALREKPFFDWPFVYDYLQRLSGGVTTPPPVLAPPAAGATPAPSSVGSLLGTLADRFRQLIKGGQEAQAITEAIRAGKTDMNKLADLVFYARHSELNGRRLRPEERQLAQEWLSIRDSTVRPLLARLASVPAPAPNGQRSTAGTSAPAPISGGSDLPGGPFGTLTVNAPDQYRFSYPLTAEDAIWMARLIRGEAGGRNDPDNAAVIWAVFNRFALFTHAGSYWMKKAGLKGYPTLAEFVQAYSTTLQPVLKSPRAAARAIGMAQQNPARFQYVKTGGVYPGTSIPKGQLKHHLDEIQRLSWARLSPETQSVVLAAFGGKLRNPVGIASDFANTATYYRQARKETPTIPQWRDFTHAHAREKKRTWIGDKQGLNQFKSNAFFIDNRVKDLPPDTVTVR